MSNFTQDPPFIILSNSEQISSSSYQDSYTTLQNSNHSSNCIAPSLFLSTCSNKTFELIFAKPFDQNFNVSSLSIVFESSTSIIENNFLTLSSNLDRIYILNIFGIN